MERSFKLMRRIAIFIVLAIPFHLTAQNIGSVNGNFQVNAQTYHTDDALGISDSVLNGNTFRMNGYGDIRYNLGNFSAGMRFESYLPPLAGYDPQYEGYGIPYWFADYTGEKFQITAGHFYEQFGNGMIFRSYQDWDLGYDNNISGMRVKFNPGRGIYLKALAGVHRYYWEKFEDGNRGIIKAFDMEVVLNDLIKGMQDDKTQWIIGGSFVSKYEPSQKSIAKKEDTLIIKYEYKIPTNVAAYAARLGASRGGFSLHSEFVQKLNNPSAFNNYIYKVGQGLLIDLSYSKKGLGVYVAAKRIDNMSYKSKITELNNVADINFIPPLTTQHVYTLATIYPYATQLDGENAIQGQVNYLIPKGSKLGGKTGLKLEVNYSLVHGIDMQPIDDQTDVGETGTLGYKSDWFSFGDLYFQDFNIKGEKRKKEWKLVLQYLNLTYNIAVIEGHPGADVVHANIGIADFTYKFTDKHSLRIEYQQLFTKQDKGDWAMLLAEFNIAPKWFFTVFDQYNYGHPDPDLRLHYYTFNIAYDQGPNRISLGYGRQREGLICVGGVCRQVPAANGVTLAITSSF